MDRKTVQRIADYLASKADRMLADPRSDVDDQIVARGLREAAETHVWDALDLPRPPKPRKRP